MKQVHSDSATL